jgi:site-specific recombinase XerD
MTQDEILSRLLFHAQLRGLSPHTVKEYYTKVKQYQLYFGKPATELGITDIQNYLYYLRTEKKLANGSINTYNSGLRFLYNVVLEQSLNLYKIPCLKKHRDFPDIFTRQEVAALFDACTSLRDKCMLMTIYGAGLRISEVVNLRVKDVDSSNMQLFICNGKGGKDRYALLSQTNLEILRDYWKAYKPKEYLFRSRKHARSHMTTRAAQDIFIKAKLRAGITKHVTPHTLRHSFATHLLEDGVSIYHIKQLLGHADISTTCFYLHLTKIKQINVKSPLDSLLGKKT